MLVESNDYAKHFPFGRLSSPGPLATAAHVQSD